MQGEKKFVSWSYYKDPSCWGPYSLVMIGTEMSNSKSQTIKLPALIREGLSVVLDKPRASYLKLSHSFSWEYTSLPLQLHTFFFPLKTVFIFLYKMYFTYKTHKTLKYWLHREWGKVIRPLNWSFKQEYNFTSCI